MQAFISHLDKATLANVHTSLTLKKINTSFTKKLFNVEIKY